MRLLAILLTLTIAVRGQQTVFRTVFTGVTTAQASGPLPNTGQGMHLLTLMFPGAAADVTSLQVRLEGSFDNTSYFPITEDITAAKSNGTYAYAMARGNGNWPYVRVRAIAASASQPMTAYYTGGSYPIGNVILDTDRYLATGTAGYDRFTWVICNGSPCSVAANLTNLQIATAPLMLTKCWIAAKTAATGAALVVDIKDNGTSIFGATKLQLPAGDNGPASLSTFAAPRIAEGDTLTIDITQVGSVSAGSDVTVVCRLTT